MAVRTSCLFKQVLLSSLEWQRADILVHPFKLICSNKLIFFFFYFISLKHFICKLGIIKYHQQKLESCQIEYESFR